MHGESSKKAHLSPQRRADIIALASEVFGEYFTSPPADPLRVFEDHRITHSFGHYEDAFDGLLECDETNEFHVYCNIDRGNAPGTPRSRFTLSHELAHYFIDEHRLALMSGRVKPHPSLESEMTTDLIPEQEADLFASFFLMPEDLCHRLAPQFGNGYEAIRRLAQAFHVSFRCAAIRYVENEAHPGAVVFWSNANYAWKRVSNSLWMAGCRKSIEQASVVPPDSATGEMMQGNLNDKTAVCEGHSTLAAWFPNIARRTIREVIVREQSIRLGETEILTLIEPLNWNQSWAEIHLSADSNAFVNWSSN